VTVVRFDRKFFLNGVTSKLAMKVDTATNYTLSVLGCVQKRTTKKRDSPPSCGNGFETAGLPFAKGHVIALELGGSDDPYNVVPQFEYWQGLPNGAWRQMESEVYEGAPPDSVMLVEIGYGRTGLAEPHDNAEADFLNDKLMNWTDPRIPDEFRVRVWTSKRDPTALSRLDTDNVDKQFDALVSELETSKPCYEKRFQLGVEVPQPDREYYVNQSAMFIAEDLWEKARPKLLRDESFATYMLMAGSVAGVRAECAKDPRLTPTEANVHAAPIIMSYQKITRPQVKKKRKALEDRGIATIDESELGPEPPPAKKRKTK
jgi:hypothetical protein